ncbi:DUF3263 domain-containing protein [Streptomyces sp. t39]|uniref:DUF3263 domain-containing protein n=1 Tax=Streptomyces sp. t39 TaxID=1828156 RepID=UPI0011CD9DF1|nr:DUF3263 domain-containing protein [Streptomyces sp. t39]TXS57743.1 DUF3263 domain-containing protein [Streptomyces sp. t39]
MARTALSRSLSAPGGTGLGETGLADSSVIRSNLTPPDDTPARHGAKERAIREQLGMSPVRYYQLLNALLDDRRALAHDPVTVNRLRRVRDARRSRR